MTRRIALLLFIMVAICGNTFADAIAADSPKALTVHSFQFKHKEADKAAAIIKTLMSPEGSISLQPGTNALVITDRAENMKAIAAALAQYDAPPVAVRLSVRLIAASRSGGSKVPDDLKDVAAKLAMLRYNSLESLGTATIEGHEGEPGIVEMESGYRADFRFGEYDASSDSIRVVDFKLSRLQKDQLSQILKTTLNLKVGQTLILGATRDPESQRAVMLVVIARR